MQDANGIQEGQEDTEARKQNVTSVGALWGCLIPSHRLLDVRRQQLCVAPEALQHWQWSKSCVMQESCGIRGRQGEYHVVLKA